MEDLAKTLLDAAALNRRAFPHGGYESLDATTLQVLLAVCAQPGQPVVDLAESLELKQNTASHALVTLRDRGLATQQNDPGDARVRRNIATIAGHELADRFLKTVERRVSATP